MELNSSSSGTSVFRPNKPYSIWNSKRNFRYDLASAFVSFLFPFSVFVLSWKVVIMSATKRKSLTLRVFRGVRAIVAWHNLFFFAWYLEIGRRTDEVKVSSGGEGENECADFIPDHTTHRYYTDTRETFQLWFRLLIAFSLFYTIFFFFLLLNGFVFNYKILDGTTWPLILFL